MTNTDTELEKHVRLALAAAADNIHPDPDQVIARTRHPAGRRWIPALVAAAVVVAVVVAAATMLDHGRQRQEAISAGVPTVSEGIGNLDGVRFPVPDGWTVGVMTHDATASTICISPAPVSDACTGVVMRVAIAQPGGSITALPQNPLYLRSQNLTVDSFDPVGGRPGIREHFTFSSPAGTGTVWLTNDLALEVSVLGETLIPAAERIVDGLDLSGWPHRFGPVLAEYGSASSGPPEAPTPTG